MEIRTLTERESQLIEDRFRAIAYAVGPTVELTAFLHDGRVLKAPVGGLAPAAQLASLLEKTEGMLRRVRPCVADRRDDP